MEQLEAYERDSSESSDYSEEAILHENSAEDETIATGELEGEEHDDEEMDADDSAGGEGRPIARHTDRSSRDAMMARLDRLANEFKDTVHALKAGKGMARRISLVKRPRRAHSPSLGNEQVDDLGGYKVNKVSIASLTYYFLHVSPDSDENMCSNINPCPRKVFEPITIALIVLGADVIIIQSYCIRS